MDTIANMFSSIKNALAVSKENTEVDYSKVNVEIAKILKKEGFILDYKENEHKNIEIDLKYKGKKPYINCLERISKSSCRRYCKSKEIPRILSGLGMVIISTPKGILTGNEAKKKGLGGELICKIW